ncbi:argininosuccinate lyase [Exiguobacterium indicum]|uniref:Argininosuccinate lyase n=1 Tax=Exiguobacterium indicum TaxID=296995 RepID=A0A0V8GCQ9_9BACL|nr:argininosuccinate lyase [Exiguobacterium enclense]KSU48068.1 argininosuccinate lyase [Exiguobacterium enclense]SDD13602.1 argininosuccinate lyase [Exiguobacterium enclense]
MTKLWGGRFTESASAQAEAFGASITFDQKLASVDLKGSLAHAQMLFEQGILAQDEWTQIEQGLKQLETTLSDHSYTLADEDIHMNLERLLTEQIGPVAGKLHTARSRNDQVATDLHLWMEQHVEALTTALRELQSVITEQAEQHIETVMPGYTHLQRAQPISLAHHLLAYFWMFERDVERLTDNQKRIRKSPLGAGALAGTTFPINRFRSAELLGFESVYPNSLDAVSDRDFVIEYLGIASTVMMHLSRFCEEIIIWASQEFSFIELSDAFSTGSSMMPQKKNPDFAELIRGKTGRVYGNLMGFLTTMKALPLAYNKDMQEDKEGVFDTADTVLQSVQIFTGMIESATFKTEALKKATMQDFSNATELADYLVTKGIPFREAHEIVGKAVLYCVQNSCFLKDLNLETYQTIHPDITEDVYPLLDPVQAVARRTSYGGTGFAAVSEQLELAKQHLAN